MVCIWCSKSFLFIHPSAKLNGYLLSLYFTGSCSAAFHTVFVCLKLFFLTFLLWILLLLCPQGSLSIVVISWVHTQLTSPLLQYFPTHHLSGKDGKARDTVNRSSDGSLMGGGYRTCGIPFSTPPPQEYSEIKEADGRELGWGVTLTQSLTLRLWLCEWMSD